MSERFLTVEFPGGTVGEFVRAIAATPSAKAIGIETVVVSEEADGRPLGPISAADVQSDALINLVSNLNPNIVVSYQTARARAEGDPWTMGAMWVVAVRPDAEPPPKPAPITFDLNFPGGPVETYVGAVRQACPGANIVILGNAGKAPVPQMTFRGVTVGAAMRALETNLRDASGAQSFVRVRAVEIENSSESVFKVELEEQPPPPQSAEDVRVWSLALLMEVGEKPADILSSIEAALSVLDGQPKMKYHEATHLLIARGSKSHLNTIEQVMQELRQSAESRLAVRARLKE